MNSQISQIDIIFIMSRWLTSSPRPVAAVRCMANDAMPTANSIVHKCLFLICLNWNSPANRINMNGMKNVVDVVFHNEQIYSVCLILILLSCIMQIKIIKFVHVQYINFHHIPSHSQFRFTSQVVSSLCSLGWFLLLYILYLNRALRLVPTYTSSACAICIHRHRVAILLHRRSSRRRHRHRHLIFSSS